MPLFPLRRTKGDNATATDVEAKNSQDLSQIISGDDFLMAVKPKEGFFFNSDYYTVDGDSVATVLSFFHDVVANDDFPVFWGVALIPNGLPDGVTVQLIDKKKRHDEASIRRFKKASDQLGEMNKNELSSSSATKDARLRGSKVNSDVDRITAELGNGDAYVHTQLRMIVKAPTIEVLDEAIDIIKQKYIGSLGTIKPAPYDGEQRQELSNIFRDVSLLRGRGYDLTSTELGGYYNLVTNGLSDDTGSYVGRMMGDINTSAINFDVDWWRSHIVVADGAKHPRYGVPMTHLWGSKISQAALKNNHRVVHIVLDKTDMDKLGPRFDSLTSRIDVSNGDINMFEIFGDKKDELNLYSANITKLTLMMRQLIVTSKDRETIASSILGKQLNKFYIDRGIWQKNPTENRHRLRVVGVPHDQVPTLHHFVAYLQSAYTQARDSGDSTIRDVTNTLLNRFEQLLETDSDLFDRQTRSSVDNVDSSRRVIYDFAGLRERNPDLAMVQLINVMSFATRTLGKNDVLIVHGVENIKESDKTGEVRAYLQNQFEMLERRDARVAFLYDNVDKAVADQDFNKFDAAHYTIFGGMREITVDEYKARLHQEIPQDLRELITQRGAPLAFLHRGFTNVVFEPTLVLGTEHDPVFKPLKSSQRRKKKRSMRNRKKVNN